MKSLARLAPCVFLFVVASYAQERAAVPIIVSGASQSSIPVQLSDFKVEVNHEPVSIASVIPLSGKHLRYVLVTDERIFNDWPGGRDQQINVAKEFLKQVISPSADVGTLVGYGDFVALGPQNERDPKKLSSKIQTSQSGPTRLYDAVTAAAQWLAKQPADPDERKVIFLVCDGKETGSHVALADALKALQKAFLPIFVFAPSEVEKRKQGQSLRELAEQSGGRTYFLPSNRRLPSNTRHLTFDGVKRDFADSFLLRLNPPSQKGLLLLRVTETRHPELSIVASSQVFVP